MGWTKNDIITYYMTNEWSYRLFLGQNFHFGYWDKGVKTQKQASLRFNQVMAEIAGITDKDHVLDAGCGVGGSSIFLAKIFGCRTTGITITPRQVEIARKNAEKAGVSHLTEFYVMDYLKTDFDDKQFSVVWGLESICYAESKKEFIQEAYRVLNDDGRLIIADGFASKDHYEGREKYLMFRWLDGWRVNFLNTPEQFKTFAGEAGFNMSSYRNVTDNVWRSSQLFFYASLPLFPFHLVNAVLPIKSYPADAIYHQYLALKKKLWEYGIFFTQK